MQPIELSRDRERGVLGPAPDLGVDRAAPDAADQVADQVRKGAGAWPLPAAAPAPSTWRALAAVGRADLAVGRLVEGHVDALWVLQEAGRDPVPNAVYGVWASASGGTGLTARPAPGGWSVDGTMRYCSGAWFLDRALVVVQADDGRRLVDVDVCAGLRAGTLTLVAGTWPAVGMDATRSVDVTVHGLAVGAGPAGERPDPAVPGRGVRAPHRRPGGLRPPAARGGRPRAARRRPARIGPPARAGVPVSDPRIDAVETAAIAAHASQVRSPFPGYGPVPPHPVLQLFADGLEPFFLPRTPAGAPAGGAG